MVGPFSYQPYENARVEPCIETCFQSGKFQNLYYLTSVMIKEWNNENTVICLLVYLVYFDDS